MTGVLAGVLAGSWACGSNDVDRTSSADTFDASTPGEPAAAAPPSSAPPSATDPADAADATLDAGDGSADATVADGDADAGAADASDGAPVGPAFCGNGHVDPNEECDPGAVYAPPACTYECQSRDFLPLASLATADASTRSRTLGRGRHPVAMGGDGAFAVVSVQHVDGATSVMLAPLDRGGAAKVAAGALASGGHAVDAANPVVASNGAGGYVAAWTDLGADGDELGIGLALANASGAIAGTTFANTTTVGTQRDPDVVLTNAGVVVAWVDESDPATAPDIKVRTFSPTLVPTSAEQTLAASADAESDVALTVFAGSFAAAWRASSAGSETIHVKAGSTEWTIALAAAGPADDRPAVVDVDGSHMLVVFSEGTIDGAGVTSGSKLRGAVLDVASPGAVAAFDIATASTDVAQDSPALVRAGNTVFLSWHAAARTSDPNGEELYVKSIGIGASAALDWSVAEISLWRWTEHRIGDQRGPALASSGSMVVGAWDDLGGTFGQGEGQGDIAAMVTAVPLVRTGDVGSVDDLTRFNARVHDVYCQRLADCCLEPTTFDLAFCRTQRIPPANIDAVSAQDVPRGHLLLSRANANSCLQFSATVACDALTGPENRAWNDVCTRAFVGTLPPGATTCASDTECVTGNYCAIASGATAGTCTPVKGKGASCADTRECVYRPLPGTDVFCTANDVTPSASGTCADTKPAGGACNSPLQCASGLCRPVAGKTQCVDSALMTDPGVPGGFCARTQVKDAGSD